MKQFNPRKTTVALYVLGVLCLLAGFLALINAITDFIVIDLNALHAVLFLVGGFSLLVIANLTSDVEYLTHLMEKQLDILEGQKKTDE